MKMKIIITIKNIKNEITRLRIKNCNNFGNFTNLFSFLNVKT